MTFTHWGRWNEPVLASSVWMRYYDGSIFKNNSLPKLTGKVMDLHHDYYYWEEDYKAIKESVYEALKNNEDHFFIKLFEYVKKEHEKKHNFCEKIKADKIENLSVKEKKERIEKLFEETKELMGCWILMFHLPKALEEFLKKEAEKEGIALEEVFAAINPPRETLLMQYEKARRELAKEIKENKNVNKEKMQIILTEFGWIGTHSYRGDGLTADQLIEQIKNTKEKKSEKKEKRKFPKNIQKIILFGSETAYYRMTSAEIYDKMNYLCRPLLNKVAEQLAITYEQLIFMTFPEIITGLEKAEVNKDEINKRIKAYGIKTEGKGVEILTGEQLEKELKKYKQGVNPEQEIKGIVAFKGNVKGYAKIVERPDQVSKVKEGDILVAPETTPDLIIAMEKAAAIITDAGGITSHAAIIARELRKPCIVGTKIATKILKDGDMIEVDAEKGIVKKLQ